MSNVINFPKKNKNPSNNESIENAELEIVTGLASLKAYHINETLEAIVPSIFNKIEHAGFELDPDDKNINYTLKDGSLIVEAIRSLLCKTKGIEHPFQKLAESLFNLNDNNEVFLADKIEINLTMIENDDTIDQDNKT